MDERKGYASRWWKWLLLYLAIGGVIYLVVYFVFFAGGGAGGKVGY